MTGLLTAISVWRKILSKGRETVEYEEVGRIAQAGGLRSSGSLDQTVKLYFTEIFLLGTVNHMTSEKVLC